MKLIHHILALALLLMFGCKTTPPEITGTWELTSLTVYGESSEWTNGSPFQTIFTNGTFQQLHKGTIALQGTYSTFLAKGYPYPCMDMTFTDEENSGQKTYELIYTIDDGILTICNERDGSRPIVLDGNESRDMRTLKRINPNQKLDPTVKTPVESGKAQGTAGQL
jgi:uncharacterized protein (TIGR03067 family)